MSEPQPEPRPAPIDAEIVEPTSPLTADYDENGVPTLDHVRSKIEGRHATSIGAAELADESAAGRSIEQQQADRDAAAKAKLEELRKSLG